MEQTKLRLTNKMGNKYTLLIGFIGIIVVISIFSYYEGQKVGQEVGIMNTLNNYNCYEKPEPSNDSFKKDIFYSNWSSNQSLFSTSELHINSPSEPIAVFSPDYKDISLNSELCSPVRCDCYDDEISCALMCFKCDWEDIAK